MKAVDFTAPYSAIGSIFSPPPIKRDVTDRMRGFSNQPHMSGGVPMSPFAGMDDMPAVTLLNGNVGILQLELPKEQREALERPNTNFGSYGTPDKPHRCKTCGRCFRLRHVMEQHELTHFKFRKYMCDICGFRAKQKAVIYRHKKVKHPEVPGAGRVTLVQECTEEDDIQEEEEQSFNQGRQQFTHNQQRQHQPVQNQPPAHYQQGQPGAGRPHHPARHQQTRQPQQQIPNESFQRQIHASHRQPGPHQLTRDFNMPQGMPHQQAFNQSNYSHFYPQQILHHPSAPYPYHHPASRARASATVSRAPSEVTSSVHQYQSSGIPTPIVVAPVSGMNSSLPNDQQLVNNNNNTAEDLSTKKDSSTPVVKYEAEFRQNPTASLLPNRQSSSNIRGRRVRSVIGAHDSGSDGDSQRSGDSLASATGLPAMVTSQSFMALPPIAPLSPVTNSLSPDSIHNSFNSSSNNSPNNTGLNFNHINGSSPGYLQNNSLNYSLNPANNLATNQHNSPLNNNLNIPSLEPVSSSNSGMEQRYDSSSRNTRKNSAKGVQRKNYTCHVCLRSFKHRHVLNQHYITHTGLRPYKCEYCDFCARQKASLWRHKQKHLAPPR